ncbi:hypothetical protein AAHA92_24933 [Salvia divinorum]|uniref:F-box/LRR-repeat protein 15/At3g58940/PEG3-like LRR domain-containing protein n=1 Tax=Salvia divinorum TaxID=28513 RepID=A0ABD1GA36_SALDI
MIDCVVNSNRVTRIKMFRVDMCGFEEIGRFESWFEFAVTKKAESIHLVGVQQLRLNGPFLRLPNTNGLDCLKDLYLCYIKMTDQDFELLVSNCPVLECLEIESCRELGNVSIVGHSKLKFVKFSDIIPLKSIVIRDAISLVSLMFHCLERECVFQLSNIPLLTKLDFRESGYKVKLAELLPGISSCIRDQLQLMSLSTSNIIYTSPLDIQDPESCWIDLVNIKHLELVIDMDNFGDQWPFSRYLCRLVESCGSLEKLVIKFQHILDDEVLEMESRELPGSLQKLTVMPCGEDALARACHDFRHISFLVL